MPQMAAVGNFIRYVLKSLPMPTGFDVNRITIARVVVASHLGKNIIDIEQIKSDES